MSERKLYINRGECPFHPDENFACVKYKGSFSEDEAQKKAGVLNDIFSGRAQEVIVTGNGDSEGNIPQMCLDCKYRTENNPAERSGNPSE